MRRTMIRNEKEIKRWFSDHVATLTKLGDIEILDWRKPDTYIFGVRYVFDGCHMYVSGDCGEAVFWFSERAYPQRIATYSLDYFDEKMRAFCNSERDFDRDVAKKYLAEMRNEDVITEKNYTKLLNLAEECLSVREWEHLIYDLDIPGCLELAV
jgi:hypothetical protein